MYDNVVYSGKVDDLIPLLLATIEAEAQYTHLIESEAEARVSNEDKQPVNEE